MTANFKRSPHPISRYRQPLREFQSAQSKGCFFTSLGPPILLTPTEDWVDINRGTLIRILMCISNVLEFDQGKLLCPLRA